MIDLGFEDCFNEFCKNNGYTGRYRWNHINNQFEIIISKGDDNAGAFLTEQEYEELTEKKLQDILDMLHKGFQTKFNK